MGALYVRMMHSENILVQYMARRSMYNVLGTLGTSLAARGGNLAKIPPNQVIDYFGRGSSVESESE